VIEGKHTGRILADLEKQVGADCLSQVIIQESNACVPNYWPWALVFPMVGVRILIDLALYRLISNAIDVEIEHDKEGERLRGTSEW
jgi:hypothetical protein